MIHTVAFNIEASLSEIDIAMAVLGAAIDRATDCDKVKATSGADYIWQQEVSEISRLMIATASLMRAPVEELEDIKGAVLQLAKEDGEACNDQG